MNFLILSDRQVEGHSILGFSVCSKLVAFISRALQIVKHVKPSLSAPEQHSGRSAYSLFNELGRIDSGTCLFPWSSYRTLSHFFLRPKIVLVIDDYRREQWKRDVPIFQYNQMGEARQPRGNIRLVTIVVFNYGAYPLEEAAVHVHVVKKKRALHEQLVRIVGVRGKWEFPPDVKVAWDTEPDEAVYQSVLENPSENDVAKQVRDGNLSNYTTTIDPRYEKVAVVAFAVQGHTNAYLTDAKTTPLAMGKEHTLLISISGRTMPSTRPRMYRLSLEDWDHLSLKRLRL